MVMHWFIAIIVSIFQEVVTYNALLFKAHQGAYPLIVIHILFVLATIFDIWVGYVLGLKAKKKFTKGKIVAFANKVSDRFNHKLGKSGRVAALLFLGTFSFPYINSFIAAWLDIPFWEMFIYLFLGNVLSYILSWVLVLGVSSVFSSPTEGSIIVVVISVLLIFCIPRMKK